MPTDPASPGTFNHYAAAIYLTLVVLIIAFAVNRFRPHKRRSIRWTTALFLFYLLAFGTAQLFSGLVAIPGIARTAGIIAELLGIFTVINLAALAIFELGLPAIGMRPARLLVDVGIGIAYAVAILVTMRRVGVDLSGIVATSAVVTGILALSFQATLGNVLGGISLQLDNSIRVGDWIRLDDGREGCVRQIRWRHTVIETRDWDTLIVPNASLLAATIMILGKREGEPVQHRMTLHFNVDFRYSPVEVCRVVQEALRASPIRGVATSPPPDCVCKDFARDGRDSFAFYAVRYWLTDLARDDVVNSEVRSRIYASLKRANIPLAVPAQHLWIEHDSVERRARKQQRELDERIAALRSVDVLLPLTDDEVAEVAESLSYTPFLAGEVITRQGSVAHFLYIVTKGDAEVRVEVNGEERPLARIEAPGFFGEMGLMTGEPRSATVVAVTDVECYRLDKESFQRIIAMRADLATEISDLLAKRRVELQSAKDELDAPATQRRIDAEKRRLLSTIQSFFGLSEDDPRGRRSQLPARRS